MSKLIALTGATGYVGRFVTAELLAQGYAIRALARPDSDRRGFPAPIDWVDGGLSSVPTLVALTDGAQAVVHMAYEHVAGRYRGGEGDDLSGWLDSNLNGSLRLLNAAQHAEVGQFIFLSSRAVFSYIEAGRVLDESHPTAPDSNYGAYKAAVEAFMSSAAHAGKLKATTIRATGVYGLTWPPERSKWWDIIHAVLTDQPLTTSRTGTEVHGADVARAVAALIAQPDAAPTALHLSDLTVSTRDIVRLARALSGFAGDLPAESSSVPQNVMVSRHLARLGITLGGISLLERTVQDLINLQSP